jgi:hypothetical protein
MTYDTTAYSHRPNVEEFTREMMAAGFRRLKMSELTHGDVLRMSFNGWPVHAAIYEIDDMGREWYIHAYLPHKKVTRDPLTPEKKALISSVWRFPE